MKVEFRNNILESSIVANDYVLFRFKKTYVFMKNRLKENYNKRYTKYDAFVFIYELNKNQ